MRRSVPDPKTMTREIEVLIIAVRTCHVRLEKEVEVVPMAADTLAVKWSSGTVPPSVPQPMAKRLRSTSVLVDVVMRPTALSRTWGWKLGREGQTQDRSHRKTRGPKGGERPTRAIRRSTCALFQGLDCGAVPPVERTLKKSESKAEIQKIVG